MTEADVIAHWKKRAEESLLVARLSHERGLYADALFHCHLAAEKALKVEFMKERRKDPPLTHNLLFIAQALERTWSEDERRQMDYLTQYAVASRYDDPLWAERESTQNNSAQWINFTEKLLSSFSS